MNAPTNAAWLNYTDSRRSTVESTHIYPLFGPSHLLRGLECWCHPQLAPPDDGGSPLIVHNAAH